MTDIQQSIVCQIETRLNQLQIQLDSYSIKLLENYSVKSTKPIQTLVNDIAKLVDTLDVLSTNDIKPISRTRI